jgi:hypothetical protein
MLVLTRSWIYLGKTASELYCLFLHFTHPFVSVYGVPFAGYLEKSLPIHPMT